jgi:elongation factor P
LFVLRQQYQCRGLQGHSTFAALYECPRQDRFSPPDGKLRQAPADGYQRDQAGESDGFAIVYDKIMLSISDLKTGKTISLGNEPYLVTFHQHSKTGRAGAVLRTKLRNLKNGAVLEKTFQGSDKIEEAEMTKSKAQFLYRDGKEYFFMDTANFDQFSLPESVLGEFTNYLLEGTEVTILVYGITPINIELPVKMEFKVVEAPPAIKGNTADGGSKQVTLETGIKVNTPLFIRQGDIIRINTETGEYTERAR